jgi:hypothetical protein
MLTRSEVLEFKVIIVLCVVLIIIGLVKAAHAEDQTWYGAPTWVPVATKSPSGDICYPDWMPRAPVWTKVTFNLEPLTVNCKALYEGLLPQGECYLFGRIIGGFAGTDTEPCWFDLSDGYKLTVRVYPIEPLKITDNVFCRVRMFVEVKGRGDADEIIIMVGE